MRVDPDYALTKIEKAMQIAGYERNATPVRRKTTYRIILRMCGLKRCMVSKSVARSYFCP